MPAESWANLVTQIKFYSQKQTWHQFSGKLTPRLRNMQFYNNWEFWWTQNPNTCGTTWGVWSHVLISCNLYVFFGKYILNKLVCEFGRMENSIYPMLRADSRFWLVNNREIWRRISRLTSSAWGIKTKERHWWRHNGDSDRRPLSLPLRYDLVTLCLYDDLG